MWWVRSSNLYRSGVWMHLLQAWCPKLPFVSRKWHVHEISTSWPPVNFFTTNIAPLWQWWSEPFPLDHGPLGFHTGQDESPLTSTRITLPTMSTKHYETFTTPKHKPTLHIQFNTWFWVFNDLESPLVKCFMCSRHNIDVLHVVYRNIISLNIWTKGLAQL